MTNSENIGDIVLRTVWYIQGNHGKKPVILWIFPVPESLQSYPQYIFIYKHIYVCVYIHIYI